MKNDPLGRRIKHDYEDRTRYSLPRRTHTIIRLDGKAFHTLTRKAVRPFDVNFRRCLNQAAAVLCSEAMGVQFAYVQSDEISLLLTDFHNPNTESWFDGNLQKICSVSASIVTAVFNGEDYIRLGLKVTGYFDCRVFVIPDPVEVENYFIWRQRDCVRNSIIMVAQTLYGQKELHGKDSNELQEMIYQKGQNWAKYDPDFKNGSMIVKDFYAGPNDSIRSRWVSAPACIFSAKGSRELLRFSVSNKVDHNNYGYAMNVDSKS